MIGTRQPTQAEKNYTLRRIVYDVLIATKAVIEFDRTRGDFSKKESFKVAALIMARNLNAFLFQNDYRYDDDIHVGDFGLQSWAPSKNVELTKVPQKCISKVVGHVVARTPQGSLPNADVKRLVVPLIRESCEFIDRCVSTGTAAYTGAATGTRGYVARLNSLLPEIGVSKIPG
ncbi:MAG: hypothetical protein A3K19_09095 [Lentisphaerae bacterium RIFOXYB12_FULL_65_16]|nr:MAG: hypothetical protein A3K18_14785 [Lentisphaerae bacterium RIFOXYA12_64_32]OGV90341.1 MAG: hypothetical protein A3K19_09095 [Lentisphaerae bacterium RIFOXYB12_FULL_65_16]